MLGSENLKTTTTTYEKEVFNEVAEKFAYEMVVNVDMNLMEAKRNGQKELIIGKFFRDEGLLKEAVMLAAIKLSKKGLAPSFTNYKQDDKKITVLKILW